MLWPFRGLASVFEMSAAINPWDEAPKHKQPGRKLSATKLQNPISSRLKANILSGVSTTTKPLSISTKLKLNTIAKASNSISSQITDTPFPMEFTDSKCTEHYKENLFQESSTSKQQPFHKLTGTVI